MTDSPPDSRGIWSSAWGFGRTAVLAAAVEIKLFGALGGGPADANELARRTGCAVRGIEALTGALVGMGLLVRDGQGRFDATPTARCYLGPDPQIDLGPQILHSKALAERWWKLADCVRSGAPLPRDPAAAGEGHAYFHVLVRQLFNANYAAGRALCALLADRDGFAPRTVLDIGAGAAPWSIPFAQARPDCRVTVLDYPDVLSVTREYAQRHGVAERYELIGGEAESADLGRDRYDLVLVGHVYHSIGPRACADLARRAGAALRRGGLLAVAEFVIDDDRGGPLIPLLFACNMLLGTELGTSYTARQIDDWARSAGLVPIVPAAIPTGSPVRLARKP